MDNPDSFDSPPPAAPAYESLDEWRARTDREEALREEAQAAAARKAAMILARAVAETSGVGLQGLSEACSARARETHCALAALGSEFGEAFSKGFSGRHATAQASIGPRDPGSIIVQATVHSATSAHVRTLACKASEPRRAPDLAAKAAMMALMASHPWLCDGIEEGARADEGHDDGWADAVAFAGRLHELGADGLAFRRMLAEEAAASHPRWKAGVHFEEMAKAAAAMGLLPPAFARSKFSFEGGAGSEPTLLVGWDIAPRASFGSRSEADVLSAIFGRSSSGDERSIELPPLSAGLDALWEETCRRIAATNALGWPALPQHVSGSRGFVDGILPAAEKLLLSEDGEPADAPRRPPKSL